MELVKKSGNNYARKVGMKMNDVLVLKDVKMNNNGFLLHNVDFVLPRGSVLGIIGQNRVGKTTLIKTILGAYTLDAGDIIFFDHTYDQDWETLLNNIAYIGSDEYLNPYMRILRKVKEYKKMYTSFDEQAFYSFLEKKGINPKTKFEELSLRQFKLVEIYFALSRKPQFLILDEPMANLDPIARKEIIYELHQFMVDENNSIIISSHILSDLEKNSDYSAFVNKGEIILFERMDRLDDCYLVEIPVECVQEEHKQNSIYYKHTSTSFKGLYCMEQSKERIQKYNGEKVNLEDILYFISGECENEKNI